MHKRVHGYLLTLLIPVMVLGGVGILLAGLAMADTGLAATAKTLDRNLEPVIISGTAVSVFTGASVDQLFVYRYTHGVWWQIPAQIDEVTAEGAYTTIEDGLLDANDELVFMAMDLGDQAPPEEFIALTLPVSDTWYEIEVTDPLSPTRKGWAYLFRSRVLTPTFTSDYVDFDGVQHRINGQSYSLGFGTTHPGFEYLALGGSGVDILDRTKIRVYSWFPLPPQTEERFGFFPDDLIKDGPVRVIVREGKGLAYGSMVWWNIHIPKLFPLHRKAIRFSTDFSEVVSGSVHYNGVVTEGVIVDGLADAVPTTPLSPWWQISTDYGTLVQVGDSSSIGGEQSNYYLDDSALDPDDTGDQQSYGDIGVYVDDPHPAFTYTFALYSVAGTQPNVGTIYAAYFMQPLLVTASRQGLSVTLEVEPESLTVGESSILTATVVDYQGDPVSGREVVFTLVSGSGAVTPIAATTDEAGQATASLSSQAAGSVVVKAMVDSVDSNTKTVTFTAGAVATVTLAAIPESLVVGRSSTLIATVGDQYRNPISDTVVTFTLVSGSGVVTPPTAMTDEEGQATSSLSSQVRGDVVVEARADSVDSTEKTITFLRGIYMPLVFKNHI